MFMNELYGRTALSSIDKS